jgi:hypothetical protein
VAGFPTPTAESIRSVMAGIRRIHGSEQTAKTALPPELLRRLVCGLPDTLRGRRDRALLLVGFARAMRRSELIALDVCSDRSSAGRTSSSRARSRTGAWPRCSKISDAPASIRKHSMRSGLATAAASERAIMDQTRWRCPGTESRAGCSTGPVSRTGIVRNLFSNPKAWCGRSFARRPAPKKYTLRT